MYSDYVGYDYLLQACEGRSDMALALGRSYAIGLLAKLPEYVEVARNALQLQGTACIGHKTSSGIRAADRKAAAAFEKLA
jgi:hypothetical protein